MKLPRIPAGWRRQVAARDERIMWPLLLGFSALLEGSNWWRGQSLSLVATRLALWVVGIAMIAIAAEIVRRVRQRRESN